MSPDRYWCEAALVDGAVERNVVIGISAGRFESIEAGSPPPAGSFELPGLTLPGFANAHSHAFHRALRSRTQRGSGSFWSWREVMYRAAERLDPESYHRLARATFAEMAMAGISAVGEFHYVHHQPDGTPYGDPNAMGLALISAAAEAGIRITLLDTLYLHGGMERSGYMDPTGVQVRFSDGDAGVWAARVSKLGDGDRHRIGAAIHSVRAVDPESMIVAVQWAEANDAPLHAHVSEQRIENDGCAALHGRTPVQVLADAGALGSRFCAVHATHLTGEDRRLLAESGSSVCMCPTTERDLGDGIGPTSEFVAAGIEMSLGTDSHASIDMFEEARALELDERLRSERRGVHSAEALLRAATIHGHRQIGWSDAGEIAIGNRADLVTVSADSVRMAGAGLHQASAVFAAGAADVSHVVVDGVRIVAGHRHTSIDVAGELDRSIRELLDG